MRKISNGRKHHGMFSHHTSTSKVRLTFLMVGILVSSLGSTALAHDVDEAAAEKVPEIKKSDWEKSASIGFTLTDGNSDTLLGVADLQAIKKWEKNELGMSLSGSYGKNGGDKNNESVRGLIQYNRLLTERFYILGRQEGFYDAPAEIHYRFITSVGAGYYFIKKEEASLSGEVGPGFVAEKQGDNETQYFTARIAERYERKLNERARVWQTAEFLPKVDDPERYLFNFELGLETAITETTSLRAVFQDFYNNKPADGRDNNDLRLVTALVMKF